MCIWTRHFFILNAWGVLREFLGGGELLGSHVLTLFQTKKCHVHTRFQARSLKSRPVFRPGL